MSNIKFSRKTSKPKQTKGNKTITFLQLLEGVVTFSVNKYSMKKNSYLISLKIEL